jgi:CHAT domain-containing protein
MRLKHRCCALATTAIFLSLCCTSAHAADDGFLIRLGDQSRIEVVPYQVPRSGRDESNKGIAVWFHDGAERSALLPGSFNTKDPSATATTAALRSNTRGGSSGNSAGPESMTFQPEQLLGQVVTRAAGLNFITPADQGACLNGKITLRRRADEGKEKYPAAEVVLWRGTKQLVTIPFAAGVSELRWEDISNLPEDLKAFLPAGAYTLRVGKGPVTSFRVVEPARAAPIYFPVEGIGAAVGWDSPTYFLALSQHLGYQKDEQGELISYTADVLDALEAAAREKPALAKQPWYQSLHAAQLRRLTVSDPAPPADLAATGNKLIDQARAAIQEGNWQTALQTLDLVNDPADARAQALVQLYRAVILAESGSSSGDQPDQLYQAAIAQLRGGEASDLFRAHNNYGGMLYARARDQLHNHAFQTASGAGVPFLRALEDWRGAQIHYELALEHAAKLPPALAAGVRVNLAGLYALLADVIRTLESSPDNANSTSERETTAIKIAREYAGQALAKPAGLDPISRAAAYETLAQLAFRGNELESARQQAELARAAYVEAEALAGIEGIERLLGLIDARDPQQTDSALRHLTASHLLTELLRQRIPADRAGRSRAGFFSRRAYVYERMIELLLARGAAAEALAIAEEAKARSLQEILTQRGVASATPETLHGLSNLFAEWPAETVAVEYFLGTERAWVFVVNARGQVKAASITDSAGKPIPSRQIVRRVQKLLAGFEGQANKLYRQATAGIGFDRAWQEELHTFYNELLPEKLRPELAGAKHLVIVPHHVLNYFPFAALVTALDPQSHGKTDMPQPNFLIDEPYALSRAPSLAVWDLLRRKNSKIGQVQAVGIVDFETADSLPGVEQDLANLKEAFGSRLKKVFAAKDATEQNIRTALAEPGMLFIGTHGQNIAEQPLESFLLCQSHGSDDGRLTAGELFGAESKAALVVLSACYSGLADRSPLPGDDLFGLERAFLNAGTATIVTGLWDVYDGTGPELMKSFFTELSAGKPAAAALAEAQRRFLKERRQGGPSDPWIHPYFWAVYTISGSELTALERSAR